MSNSGPTAIPYTPNPGARDPDGGLEHERAYVAMLYAHLDARRADTAGRLHGVLHDETVGTPQALTERDAAVAMYTDRLAALRAAEHGLAFGRLDAEDGERRYVGRM
ncbi:MAG: helicase, partial [Pseudonocardia sp.]